jgi:hypothetical protein
MGDPHHSHLSSHVRRLLGVSPGALRPMVRASEALAPSSPQIFSKKGKILLAVPSPAAG